MDIQRPPYSPFQPILTPAGLRHSGITAVQHAPRSLLQDKVFSYIQIKVTQPTPYHVLPDATQALYFSPQKCWLSGVQRMAFAVPLFEPGEYFGVRFLPGVLRHFFALEVAEVTDLFIDHTQLPDAALQRLTHQIYQQNHFSQRVTVCEQWLLQRFKPMLPTRFSRVLNLAYHHSGNIRVSDLASRAGWSERHLNREFQHHVGVATKTFLQILRLQQLYKQRASDSTSSVTTALSAGYFDQAHCIKTIGKTVPLAQRTFFDQLGSDFYNQ